MKVLESTECIGDVSLETAFGIVFGEETFKRVYPGEESEQSGWSNDERTSRFTIDLGRIPVELRMFACDRHMRVDCKQHRDRHSDVICVHTRFKMHFVGSELFSIRPTFTLIRDTTESNTFLKVRVEHRARLPLPFNEIVEAFMRGCSRKELERNWRIIQARLKETSDGEPEA